MAGIRDYFPPAAEPLKSRSALQVSSRVVARHRTAHMASEKETQPMASPNR